MGADIGTLVALGARLRLPFGHIHRDPPLFILCCPLREGPVFPANKCTDRKIVTLKRVYRKGNVPNEIWHIIGSHFYGFRLELCPGRVHLDLVYLSTPVNGCKVHIYNIFTFPAVTLHNEFTHLFNRLLVRDDLGDLEEGGLHNGIGPTTKAYFRGNLGCIDGK